MDLFGTDLGTTIGIVLIPLCTVGCIGGFVAIKLSQPYKDAIKLAQQHPLVIEEIGTPVKPGFWLLGSVTWNSTSTADLRIPIRGPKGFGIMRIVGRKDSNQWKYHIAAFESWHTSRSINLKNLESGSNCRHHT